MIIPAVEFSHFGKELRACTTFVLEAMAAERTSAGPLRQAEQLDRLRAAHGATIRLLQLVSRWEWPAVVELHLVSRPSVDPEGSGRIELQLRLHTCLPGGESEPESNKDILLERALSGAFRLERLISCFWPHAQVRPVRQSGPKPRHSPPFQPQTCLAVIRRREVVPLTEPVQVQLRRFGLPPHGGRTAAPIPASVDHWFPWVPSDNDWSALLSGLLSHTAPQWMIARVANGADSAQEIGKLESTIRICEQYLAGMTPNQLPLAAHVQLIRDTCLQEAIRLRDSALRVSLLLLSPGAGDRILAGLAGQTVTSDSTRSQRGSAYSGGYAIAEADVSDALNPWRFSEPAPVTCDEAACALRLPIVFSEQSYGLPLRQSRMIPAPEIGICDGGATILGTNRHGAHAREIRVDIDHRLKHTFLIGMTGTGKSTTMLSMLLQDLRAGYGVALIDPHGELADDLLTRFPENRVHDLILIDLAERRRPLPMNLLAWETSEERDLIADELLTALLRVYRDPGMFGPIFENHFRSMLKLLMGEDPRRDPCFTLLEFAALYQSKALREHLAHQVSDEQVKDFIRELNGATYGDYKPENIAPYITSKFSRFTRDSLLQRILGDGRMMLNIDAILDEGRVLVMKLGRGRFGANLAELVTSQIVARFRLAAMRRLERDKQARKPFFLFVDELGSMANDENFSQLLSEARKCGLGLVLATQYMGQLRDRSSRDILSAVLGNVGTLISFRVGVEDAGVLAPAMAAGVTEQDLMACPNYEGYMRIHAGQASARPFSFHNRIDSAAAVSEHAVRLARQSRRRWGAPVEECDRRIAQRRRFIESLG